MRRPRLRPVALIFVCSLVAVSVCGALYEAIASARDARIPPPGVLVDVGGRRLHLLCIGSGQPTVLFEPSSFGRSVSFSDVRTALAKTTRVCSYDRMGSAWSDPGPSRVSVGMLADDLRRLQDAAPLASPLVIVASSMGGAVAELFARRYPERVAGLVFLDAANSELTEFLAARADRPTRLAADAACVAIRIGGPLGFVRLIDRRPTTWSTLCAVARALPDSVEEFRKTPPLPPDIPLVVLSAESTDDVLPVGHLLPASFQTSASMQAIVRQLRETHRHLAARSTRGTWRAVPGSGHLIAESRPQAVVDAVRSVLDAVRGR